MFRPPCSGPGSAEQRDRTTLRVAGRAPHRVRGRDSKRCPDERSDRRPPRKKAPGMPCLRRNHDRRPLRVEEKFSFRISLFLPVQSSLQKYFTSPVGQIISTNSRHPTPPEGRWPSSRTRGGMRWTRQRFARDGVAGRVERPVSGHRHADERCCSVRQNRVVLTPRCWRQVRGVASARPGLDKTYPLMTVAKEPGHRGERDISR
jgi:hypothetical protein